MVGRVRFTYRVNASELLAYRPVVPRVAILRAGARDQTNCTRHSAIDEDVLRMTQAKLFQARRRFQIQIHSTGKLRTKAFQSILNRAAFRRGRLLIRPVVRKPCSLAQNIRNMGS